MADLHVLDVFLHRRPIGAITLLGGDRVLFSFNDRYIDDQNRDTLSLSFKDQYGDLISSTRPTQTRVAPFFANLLPEGPLRDYLAERANVNPRRDFFVLRTLGEDLPGAVTVRSAKGEIPPLMAEDDTTKTRDPGTHRNRPLRFSLAGVQLKFSAVKEATARLTIPIDGVGGSWIVKLPSSVYQGVPENEFSMMTLARTVGIDVPEFDLISVRDIIGLPERMGDLEASSFATRRFDRADDGAAIHIEDFAQVFRVYPERKYERATYRNIAEVLWAEAGETAIKEFIRRLTFNVLIGNADMHLKNWSLIYPDRRTAALAPAYDFVSTIAFLADSGMALNVARTRRFDEFNVDELTYLAAKARLPSKLVLDTARQTVDRFLPVWHAEKNHLGLTRAIADKIDSHIASVPLVRDA